jgi:hypothetical protein
MTMNLQERKIHFIQDFLRLNDEDVINVLEKTLKSEKSRMHSRPVTPYTIDEFNEKIDRAEEDAKNGRVRTTDELKDEIKSCGKYCLDGRSHPRLTEYI